MNPLEKKLEKRTSVQCTRLLNYANSKQSANLQVSQKKTNPVITFSLKYFSHIIDNFFSMISYEMSKLLDEVSKNPNFAIS